MSKEELLQRFKRAGHEGWTSLDLSGQKLGNVPPEVGRLTRLQSLNLRDNELRSLPPEIGQLTNLQSLDLSHNWLRDGAGNLPVGGILGILDCYGTSQVTRFARLKQNSHEDSDDNTV